MSVFVAGASGALGSRLVPQLVDAGHDVIGTHNSPARLELLRTLGAKPVMLDLLDARAVRKAVLESEPEAIVHEATALANAKWGRNWARALQHRRRRPGAGAAMAAGARPGPRREAAAARPDLARAAGRRRGRGRDGYRRPRRLQREGEARARLDGALSELAHGIPRHLLVNRRGRPTGVPAGRTDEPLISGFRNGVCSICLIKCQHEPHLSSVQLRRDPNGK